MRLATPRSLHPLHADAELQVALTLAEGATNREAAAALFLSPKTIESHLERVYRKLVVRSRSQLARLLATEPEVARGARAALLVKRS